MMKRLIAPLTIFAAGIMHAGYMYNADTIDAKGQLPFYEGTGAEWSILDPPGFAALLNIAADGTLSWEVAASGSVSQLDAPDRDPTGAVAVDNAGAVTIPGTLDITGLLTLDPAGAFGAGTGLAFGGGSYIRESAAGVVDYSATTHAFTGTITGTNVTSGADPGHTHTAYQGADQALTDISALAVTDGNVIVGDGTNWTAESGATARASLGIATGSTDNALLRADGTGGATLQGSTVTADDSGNVAIPGTLGVGGRLTVSDADTDGHIQLYGGSGHCFFSVMEGEMTIRTRTSTPLIFQTNDVTRTTITASGLLQHTGVPTAATVAGASLSINPATAPADGWLLGLGVGGTPVFSVDEDGDTTIGGTLDVGTSITAGEMSSDPADPAEGHHVTWQSDGTGEGADGDIMMKITAGGVTKTVTIVEFSED